MSQEQQSTLETGGQEETKTFTQEDVSALQAQWSQEREQLERALNEAKVENRTQRFHYEFMATAKERGYSDPAKLLGLINLSSLDVDDDGRVTGLDSVFDALSSVKQRPKTIGDPIDVGRKREPQQSELEEAAEKARSGNPSDMAAYTKLKRLFGGK
ncbi:hypothetical protein [Paenibacillus alvei]|uniref:Scaffolding protein n=1 Tax=Paenibacillus alvei TaxID=44250 RepID=A0AAP7A240_PAEAL|nr:hypothetical protein [Paenibacillus alvei]NOJ71413.1 hypothetical protein [Paenibacillus alvei]